MAVRMKDIAQDLGVSLATVSKVLNNHTDISPATKARVLRRMKELDYKPSLHAQGLVSGRSFMVGFIVPDLVYAFFAEIAKSLSRVLRSQGYGLLISSSDEDPEIEKAGDRTDAATAGRCSHPRLVSTGCCQPSQSSGEQSSLHSC